MRSTIVRAVIVMVGGCTGDTTVRIDPGRSTLTTSAESAMADGAAALTLTATAFDSGGAPLARKTARFIVSGRDNVLTPTSVVTDATGVATATLASTRAETKKVTVELDGVLVAQDASVAFVASACGQGQIRLTAAPPLTTSADARALALADLDGDGNLDIVLADGGDGDVAVRLGSDDGTLGDKRTYPAGSEVLAVIVTDIDADGKADVLALDGAMGEIDVLLGRGDGTLEPPSAVAVGAGVALLSMAVGDINGDGKPDLIAGASSTIFIFHGHGDGTFGDPTSLTAPRDVTQVAAADVTGDGLTDIVFSGAMGYGTYAAVGFYDQNPDGSFASRSTGIGRNPQALAVGDVDGDGRADIVSADATNTLGVYLGPSVTKLLYTDVGPVGPLGVVITDLNSDGKSDISTADTSTTTFFENRGADGFVAFTNHVAAPRAIAAGDLDGDGRPDEVLLTQDGLVVMHTSCTSASPQTPDSDSGCNVLPAITTTCADWVPAAHPDTSGTIVTVASISPTPSALGLAASQRYLEYRMGTRLVVRDLDLARERSVDVTVSNIGRLSDGAVSAGFWPGDQPALSAGFSCSLASGNWCTGGPVTRTFTVPIQIEALDCSARAGPFAWRRSDCVPSSWASAYLSLDQRLAVVTEYIPYTGEYTLDAFSRSTGGFLATTTSFFLAPFSWASSDTLFYVGWYTYDGRLRIEALPLDGSNKAEVVVERPTLFLHGLAAWNGYLAWADATTVTGAPTWHVLDRTTGEIIDLPTVTTTSVIALGALVARQEPTATGSDIVVYDLGSRSGSRGGRPPRLPHHRTCRSAYGGSRAERESSVLVEEAE